MQLTELDVSELNRVSGFIMSSDGQFVATAFVVCLPFENEKFADRYRHAYVATALHCVADGHFNPRKGLHFVFPWQGDQGLGSATLDLNWDYLRFSELEEDEDFCDLAVAPLTSTALSGVRIGETQIPLDLTLDDDRTWPQIGDSTIVSGLIKHHTIDGNTISPALRFGRVSLVPRGPVLGAKGKMKAFIVENNATGGMSGAPVFVERASGGECKLVGVHVGHFQDRLAVASTPTDTGGTVALHSGFSQVIPSQQLLKLLAISRAETRRGHIEDWLDEKPWEAWFPYWRRESAVMLCDDVYDSAEDYIDLNPVGPRFIIMNILSNPWDLEESFPRPPAAESIADLGTLNAVKAKINDWQTGITWSRPTGEALVEGYFFSEKPDLLCRLRIALATHPHNNESVCAIEVTCGYDLQNIDIRALLDRFPDSQAINIDSGSDFMRQKDQ